MKDEFEDFIMDESARKSATDWLMQVISGKKSTNGQSNGAERLKDISTNGGVAVAEMPPASDMAREEKSQKAAQQFTAEDLCGSPVVPVIPMTPKNEITADDVCWVPEDMRLKPQPAPVEEPPASASKVHVMQPREEREELDILRYGGMHDADLRRPAGAPEDILTAADISREPAPYMVEHTWNGMDSGPAMREITAADIMRESSRNYISESSGSDLPTSFRVIRSTAPVVEAPAPVVEAAAPVIEAAAPVIEAAAPAVETPATVAETPASVIEAAESVASVPEPAAPEIPAKSAPQMAEVGEAEIESEQDKVEAHEIEAALEHPEDFSGLPAELKPEAADEQEVEAKAEENVFAREGFWGAAAESEAGDGEFTSKAILRAAKHAHTASGSTEYEKHPEGWISAWKTMLRLGSVLPWMARALPALESGALDVEPGAAGAASATGLTNVAQETRQDVAGLRLVQYEIRTTVQDHSMQLKRVEEQLTRVRETMDSQSSENEEVAENLRAMTKLVRLAGMGLGALLLVLIVLVIVLLAHH